MTSAASPTFEDYTSSSLAGSARAIGRAFAVLALLLAAIIGLYLIKSALGINVFSGHSPLLHAALYPLVRG